MSNKTFWRAADPLILASKSPVRSAMLHQAGLPVLAVSAEIDERALSGHLENNHDGGTEIAKYLAREKALVVSKLYPDHYVIGADQTLALNDRLLHKPGTRYEAREQLQNLSGKTHILTSAATVVRNGETICSASDEARLAMRVLTDAEIRNYLDAAGDDALISVGSYQLEGLGIHLFERIEGDYFTILGLPLLFLLRELRAKGLIAS
ncbi:MAG: Maf family nucleotide pyrophosphatase [Hyphomicrobiales bacterium]